MKKAISMLATAGLLASLLGTALVSTASADVGTWTGTGRDYLRTCDPTNCTQVADGFTQLQITDATAGTTSGPINAGYMTVTGASFTAATGNYHWDATAGTLTITAGSATGGSYIRLKSSTAGNAVVSIYNTTSPLIAGTLVGTVTVSFYAAGTSGISAANSFSKTVTAGNDCATLGYVFSGTGVSSGAAEVGTARATLCVFVGSTTAGTGVSGLDVSATISPVGLLTGTAVGQAVTLTRATVTATVPAGVYYATIAGSGVAGAATITLSTSTLAGGTIALGTQPFTFTGGVAKITASSSVGAVDKGATGTATNAVSYKIFDAAGTRLANGVETDPRTYPPAPSTYTAVASTGAPFTLGLPTVTTTTLTGKVPVTCRGTEGSGTVTVKYTSTDGKTIITSDPITVYCSGTATTFTVAFDKTTVVPGGSAVLTATAKDAAGQPAAGYSFSGVASSGNLYQTADDGDQSDGTTLWSYLAPFNSGVITAAVTDLVPTVTGTYTNMGTKYASLTVGAPVPPSVGAHVPAYSALGVTKSGPFSTSTKVAALGHFVTVKMVFGASHAGRHIQIWKQSKNSAGVWSAKAYLTVRVADASGNVYFYWRSYSAAWWSIQGRDGTTWTNPVQTRWMK